MFLAAALVFELCRESLTGTHCRYREYVSGVPTENYGTYGTNDTHGTYGTHGSHGSHSSNRRWLNDRIVHRTIVYERPLEPWAYDRDSSGALVRRTPLFFRARPARVFDPNPVVTLNDPSLQDLDDSVGAVPANAYEDVELNDAAPHGPHVTLVDKQPRNVAPPEGALVFDRSQDGFEDVNVYFHIDRSQRHLQSLGYVGPRAVVPYAVEADAHAASGTDNSYFIPSSTEAGRGTLYFGEGGTDDAEDADLVVHEYAHAIHEWIAPGTFGGAFASEARALAEGIGDYWAYSAHVDARRATGRDPYCFADWDARCWMDAASESCGYAEGTDCLRRLDGTKTMADYETSETAGVEYRNGAIWSSALREIHERAGRTVADTILVESLFGSPPRPTFAIMAERLLQADRLLYQGVHAGAICSAMFTRGIVTRCDTTPRGEWTLFQSTTHGVAIPENSAAGVTSTIAIADPRAIEGLSVRVDIDHPSRGDLLVELTGPDGTKVVLHQLSSSRTPDIHATYAVDAFAGRSAAGTWTLFVADRRPRDAGSLGSWGLEIRFAGDEPVAERPRASWSRMIPVVAHVFGQDGAYVSDVRIANPAGAPQTATLVFTRSGEETFAVQRLFLDAGQTIELDDVVERTFHTFGSGTLEVLGDVVVMSRIAGQQVPPVRDTTALGEPPLLVVPWPEAPGRVNLGLAETSGGRGRVQLDDGVDEREIEILPFGHVQFPVGFELREVRVVEGNARVAAYVSQIGVDAMFVAAESGRERRGCAPVIAAGAWRSDFWIAGRESGSLRVEPFPGAAALCMTVEANAFASTRIVHGDTVQGVPLLPDGPADQHLLFIDKSDARRTNIGFVAEGSASAEVIVYDAAGVEVERFGLSTMSSTAGGVSQRDVRAPVTNGRAAVRFTSGSGRAYTSVIGTDATFFPGQ